MTESQIKSIVGEVMAKMQLQGSVSGMHGVYADMDTAIAKAKEAQKVVRMMSMDQREKIISNIRTKIKENAETFARMGVNETGMGNVGDKILKHLLVAEKTPGTEDITTTAWSGDRGLTLVERGPFGVIGAITP
ncbi:MAG: aldehyde dehydrogenase family protein, partial [Lachnospiraceae bacterium]|nr:aldehyde dehydrogenase family protein [Lachnospiraceae bacterium]